MIYLQELTSELLTKLTKPTSPNFLSIASCKDVPNNYSQLNIMTSILNYVETIKTNPPISWRIIIGSFYPIASTEFFSFLRRKYPAYEFVQWIGEKQASYMTYVDDDRLTVYIGLHLQDDDFHYEPAKNLTALDQPISESTLHFNINFLRNAFHRRNALACGAVMWGYPYTIDLVSDMDAARRPFDIGQSKTYVNLLQTTHNKGTGYCLWKQRLVGGNIKSSADIPAYESTVSEMPFTTSELRKLIISLDSPDVVVKTTIIESYLKKD